MSMIGVDYGVLNQKGSPSWFSDIYANIPTAGYIGRMFISIDTYAFYRDTGTGWDLIGGPGTGTITGSGTSGQVSYFNGSSTLAGSNNLFWDITNSRLGIGTATPGASLDIHSTGTNAQFNGTGTNNAYLVFQNAGTSKWRIGNTYNAGANSFDIYNNGLANTPLSINSATNLITLSANVTTTGIQAIQNGLNLGYASGGATASYTNMSGSTTGINFALANGTGGASFIFPTAAGYNYTFPATTGTIALTSNIPSLAGYVPYTGATGSVDLGLNNFSAQQININGNGTNNANLYLKQGIASLVIANGFSNILATGTKIGFQVATSAVAAYYADFQFSSLTAQRTYTLPDATGTLALTSNITSAISGTTNRLSKFTSANVIGDSMVSDDGTTLTSTGATRSNLYIKAANNSYYGQIAFTNGTNASYGGISYNNASQYMQFETNTSEWMRLTNGGNFLIGSTTDNGDKLQVNGNVNISGSYITNKGASNSVGAGSFIAFVNLGNLYQNIFQLNASYGLDLWNYQGSFTKIGNFNQTTGIYTALSDINKKKDFEISTIGLNAIIGLKPTLYRMKLDNNTNKHLGFIAQEVKDFIPQAYVEDENFIGLNYNSIVAVLVKAVQELNEKLVRNNIN